MTSTWSLDKREFDNPLDVGLPVCLVHDKHSEPCQKTEFDNPLDVGLPRCLVHDKHSEPCQRGRDLECLQKISGGLDFIIFYRVSVQSGVDNTATGRIDAGALCSRNLKPRFHPGVGDDKILVLLPLR